MAVQATAFQEQEASLSGGPLHYRVGGQGRPLLYLHGASGPRVTPGLELLAETFRVFVPTMPGFDGRQAFASVNSMQELAGVAAEFAGTVIDERCDVLGHSFGGWLSCWLAVLHPERIGQLVLEASAGFRPQGVGGLVGTPEELRRKGYVYPERVVDDKPAEMVAHNRELVVRYHGRVDTDDELVSRLQEIQALTLIVNGTEDGLVPAESGRLLKRHIPNSYLCFMYDAAHGLEVDQPERFAALVREFLERAEAFIINWKG